MRKVTHQVIFIRAHKARELDIRIEDSHLEAFADEAFHELNKRTFAHIICSGLETNSKKSNSFLGLTDDPIEAAVDQRAVAFENVIEYWQRKIEFAAQIRERAQVLRQTRAAESKTGLQIGR